MCVQRPLDPGQKLIPLKKKTRQNEATEERMDKSSLKKDKSNWTKRLSVVLLVLGVKKKTGKEKEV